MSDNKNIINLTHTFIVGFRALIVCLIVIGFIHFGILGEEPIVILKDQPRLLLGILGFIMLAGILSPLIPRLYSRTLLSRCISISCATVSLVLPYAIPVVEYYHKKLFMLVAMAGMVLPISLPYLISLIFAFGEVFYIQMKPHILENWRWNIRERTTYILIPYYFVLICNILIIFRLLD